MADLEIRNLHVKHEDREILRGVDLSVSKGEIHALMGPNGSGKSTLANTILGHPSYEVTEGSIVFKGKDITEADAHDRAQAGLFLAFQYPAAIPGVSIANFLRMALNTQREEPIKVKEFRDLLQHAVDLLDVDRSFTSRALNDGFSGGEKKRAEILQMAVLRPRSPCSTRPTPGSTSTLCAPSRRASTSSTPRPAWARSSSPTTSGSCTTSPRSSSTS